MPHAASLLGCLLHSCPSTQGVSADDDDAEAELALLRDLSNEDDWGLEALTNPGVSTLDRQLRGGRRSLIDELTAAEEGEEDVLGDSSGFSGNVQWGGTAGTTGIDMEEQEAILTRYFRWAAFLYQGASAQQWGLWVWQLVWRPGLWLPDSKGGNPALMGPLQRAWDSNLLACLYP